MATNRTFTMLKPDALENKVSGKIIDKILGAGFEIKALKKLKSPLDIIKENQS